MDLILLMAFSNWDELWVILWVLCVRVFISVCVVVRECMCECMCECAWCTIRVLYSCGLCLRRILYRTQVVLCVFWDIASMWWQTVHSPIFYFKNRLNPLRISIFPTPSNTSYRKTPYVSLTVTWSLCFCSNIQARTAQRMVHQEQILWIKVCVWCVWFLCACVCVCLYA